jgi:NADP-dependent 3-hydroxy acid dehydrogenase YdfG
MARRNLQDAVVVVTGASSGIGRVTSLELARRGAAVVVAARREDLLRQLVAECDRAGGRAHAVRTDVSDERSVENLAERAVERFGRIDVWVNNAGVLLMGTFEDTPPDAFRRVIDTNFYGYVHGARAALKRFRERGRGTLINVASIEGRIAFRYSSAYAASKHAVMALSQALRQDLADTDIAVCTVLPAAIDTPLFQHAADYVGRAIKPPHPIYAPEQVAAAIVSCAARPRAEVNVGGAGLALQALRAVSPRMFERIAVRQVERDHFMDRPVPPNPGNLFAPMEEGSGVTGGWREREKGRRTVRRLAVSAAALAAPFLLRRVLGGRRAAAAMLAGRLVRTARDGGLGARLTELAEQTGLGGGTMRGLLAPAVARSARRARGVWR